MTQQDQLQQEVFSKTLLKRMLQGAAFALLLVMIIILTGPGLDEDWVLVPISFVTAGGALGGLFYHVADYVRLQRNWSKVWINILCVIVYLIGLYLSLILALDRVGLWD